MNETTHIKERNVDVFLSRFAKTISQRDLVRVHHPWGRNIVFYYRNDSVLKVAKRHGGRVDLLKEAKFLEYLSARDLPVVVPKPLLVHDKGYYALFSRIDGEALTPGTLADYAPEQRRAFARRLGEFLSFLHHHEFPKPIISRLPRFPETLQVALVRAEEKVAVLKRFSASTDVAAWEEQLKRFGAVLDDERTVTHGDLNLDHVFAMRSKTTPFAVIDFNIAMLADAAVDFAELIPGFPARETIGKNIQETLLEHYATDDDRIAAKIDLRLACDEISGVYRAFMRSLR